MAEVAFGHPAASTVAVLAQLVVQIESLEQELNGPPSESSALRWAP
jgi:hypothetical protein